MLEFCKMTLKIYMRRGGGQHLYLSRCLLKKLLLPLSEEMFVSELGYNLNFIFSSMEKGTWHTNSKLMRENL